MAQDFDPLTTFPLKNFDTATLHQAVGLIVSLGVLRWTTPGGGDSERPSTVVGDYTAAPSGDLLVLDRRGEQVAARQPLKVKGLRSLVACTTADGVRGLLQTDRQLEAYDLAVRKTISGRASGNGDH